MTFIKYTNDGKAVIQPAALVLSGLEKEDALEMHTLDSAIVLIKEEMPPVEKVKTDRQGSAREFMRQAEEKKC